MHLLPVGSAERPLTGFCFSGQSMPAEPSVKRCFAYVDGQNLFKSAEESVGYTYPNYDPLALAREICARRSWELSATYFYTGVPEQIDDPFWHQFWTAKMAVLGTRGVSTYSRALRYRNESIRLPDGSEATVLVRREKGIDVRIA